MKIDKGVKRKERSKYNFDEMEPGDSFFYKGNRNTPKISLGYQAIRGVARIEKEGDGWRFTLLEKPVWLRKKLKE